MNKEDEDYHIARMNGKSPSGIPIPEDVYVHTDKEVGITMGKTVVAEREDGTWLASCPIGTIFGSEVEGEITGVGKTREEALVELDKSRKKLNDSLWF